MVAFNFKAIHSEKILSGEKFSTIRRKRRCKPGDKLQLYTGMRTRNVKLLKTTECTAVEQIHIYRDRIEGIEMDVEEFLAMDGLEGKTFEEFADFFDETYGLPFSGHLVIWK